MRTLELNASLKDVEKALDFVENSLGEYGVTNRKMIKDAMIATEESLVKLLDYSISDVMEISINKSLLGNITIKLILAGSEFDFDEEIDGTNKITSSDDEEAELTIRDMLLTSLEDKIAYQHKDENNIVLITLKKEK